MQDILNLRGPISFVTRFLPVFSIFLGIIFISLLLTLGAMEVLSAARSFVAGESQWSKAQRDAVYALTLYAQTRESRYFKRYQQALAVPLSDREARIEMDKPNPDYTKVRAALLAGGNHPDDIPSMVRLYRCCAEYSYFALAVDIWKKGDGHIVRLQKLGNALHAEITAPFPSWRRIDSLLNEVRAVDTAVKPLEEAFTATLSEGVRGLKSMLTWGASAAISLLIVCGLYLSARIIRRIRRTEEDYRLLVNAFAHTADGVMILDASRRIVAVNHAFTNITGYTPEEVIGQVFARPNTVRIPGPTLFAVWADTRAAGRWEGEIWNVRKNGDLYPMRLSLSAVHDRRGGVVDHYVAVFNDISPYKAQEERLKYLATHDPLTGLPNRTEFERSCREAMARANRHGHRVAVLYIDLDNFKPVNDTYGHGVGDELLQIVGARMKQVIRETDIVARIGGDEFTVLLTDLDDVSRGYVVACKLLDMLSQPFVVKQSSHPLGASIGVSTYPDDGDDPQTLLRLADAAMYRIKQGGRNGVGFHSVPGETRAEAAVPATDRDLASRR